MRRIWFVFYLWAFVSCGSSPEVVLEIQIAQSATQDLMQNLEMERTVLYSSAGIYFDFCKFDSCPCFSNTSSSSCVTIPPSSSAGFSPIQSSYELDSSLLDPNSFYSVRMYTKPYTTGGTSANGVADCPLLLSAGEKNGVIHICFSDKSSDCLAPFNSNWGTCPQLKSCNCS